MTLIIMFPNLSKLQRSDIQVSRTSGNQINLHHVTNVAGKQTKTPLHIKTDCWTCPFGRDDQNKLTAVISNAQYFKVEELDQFGRDVCKHFLKDAGYEVPEDPNDLPYKSLIQTIDGLDTIQLHMSDRTCIFDKNNTKLSDEEGIQCTSGQFSGRFLLSLGLRVWTGEHGVTANSTYYWSAYPVQIKVTRYCTLPEGCKIFESEQEFEAEMVERKQHPLQPSVIDAPVTDFDPDVNELLD